MQTVYAVDFALETHTILLYWQSNDVVQGFKIFRSPNESLGRNVVRRALNYRSIYIFIPFGLIQTE